MNNKAFTLIELLGVLVLLSVIAVLVFPAIVDIIKRSEDTIKDAQTRTILKSAYDFSLKNPSVLPENNGKNYITLAELKISGLIDANIKDTNGKIFPDNLVISIENVRSNYVYDKKISMLEGNYLYKIESDPEDTSLLPTIALTGLTPNSNNNYILTLDLNSEFNNISYSAQSSTLENLTNKVKKYITVNEEVVDSIDTSTPSLYKIYYVVVDANGYSNMSVLNVIVADTTKPSIELPRTNKISTSVSSFDLLKDVTCTDNSGFCEITYTGTIDYGIKGKYVIQYSATDPSGNTTISRRVITVE